MALLSKDAILKANDLPDLVLQVDVWGGEVRIRSLTAALRDEWEASVVASNGADQDFNRRNIRARFLSFCLVDDAGGRLFATPEEIEALGEKSGAVLDELWDKARKLNRLGLNDVEELAKNSSPGPSVDSASA